MDCCLCVRLYGGVDGLCSLAQGTIPALSTVERYMYMITYTVRGFRCCALCCYILMVDTRNAAAKCGTSVSHVLHWPLAEACHLDL